MSVRMALAKLCACTCGGALIGGGAMQVADTPPAQVHKVAKKKHKVRKIAHHKPVRKVKRVRKVVRTTTTSTCTPSVVTVASQGMPPIPVPFMPPAPYEGGSSGGVPVIIGGSGGFGGGFGGGLGGGFGGGGGFSGGGGDSGGGGASGGW